MRKRASKSVIQGYDGWQFHITKRIRNQRRKLLISIYDTPGFADFEVGRACAPTGCNGQQAAMAHHLHAPVEHRRACSRARVMPGRLRAASYDPRSASDTPGAPPEPPGRAGSFSDQRNTSESSRNHVIPAFLRWLLVLPERFSHLRDRFVLESMVQFHSSG